MGRRSKRSAHRRRHRLMQNFAHSRITDLFDRAFKIFNTNQGLANRYVDIARNIAMATKIRIPLSLKRYICHDCKKLLVPGNNMRFRTHHKKHYGTYLSVTCLNCNHITRYIVNGPACSKIQKEKK